MVRYFNLFVGRKKKRKPLIEGNHQLNINIEGYIADLDTLKTCGLDYLLLFHYIKIFFLFVVVRWKKSFSFYRRDVIGWWYSPYSCLVKFLWYHYECHFPAIAMWYLRSTKVLYLHNCNYESTCSLGRQSFLPMTFKIYINL